MDLKASIESKDFVLSVVGTGRVGLPLLAAYAKAGVRRVVGIEKNNVLRDQLRRGMIPFREDGLTETWAALDRTKIDLRADIPEGIVDSSVVVVAVGTPLTNGLRPDMSQVTNVAGQIFEHCRDGCLVILRSTLAPGWTKTLILPLLKERGNANVHLVISPERIAEGYALQELEELPEIVGTLDEYSAECAEAFFHLLNPRKTILRTDPTTAETAKVLSNVYRYLNFAFANDFAMIAETLGVNAHEVIRIANTGYKRGGISLPGPSGGPCLYKDGHFLPTHTPYAEFVKTAWHINESVPSYAVSKIKAATGSLFGKSVGVLGIAFKAESDDTRDSPSERLVAELAGEGAKVVVHDPYVPGSRPLSDLAGCSIVVLSCNHHDFSKLGPEDFPSAQLFYDLWGQLSPKKRQFEACGIRFLAFGQGE